MKRFIGAIVAVFLAWSVLDFLIHGVLLQSSYRTTAHLWRPENEMNMVLMSLVTLTMSICVVTAFRCFISPRSLANGFKFGLLGGLALGTSAGFGSYCFMPIPLSLAVSWFFASLLALTVSGFLAGLILSSEN